MMRHAQMAGAMLALAAMSVPQSAVGEVVSASPTAVKLHFTADVAMERGPAWDRFVDLKLWWDGAHSYSGSSANMTLKPEAGGCWCEATPKGVVEHGRVVQASPTEILRIAAPLGPLKPLGAAGDFRATFEDSAVPGHTIFTLDYSFSGTSDMKLDTLAMAVDGVLAAQTARFAAVK